MMKRMFFNSLFVLCALIVGVVNAHAEDYDYEWVETNFSDLETGDVVVLVDNNYGSLALPNNDSDFRGVEVNVRGNKLSGTVADGIQWTLTKTGSTVAFKKDDTNALCVSSTTLSVKASTPTDFTYNSGLLSYDGKYIAWSYVTYYKAVLQEGTSGPNYLAAFTFYKKIIKNYVKWKKVEFNSITDGDVLAIVDNTTANAMSNDKGADKAPSAVAVKLNADKDRITGTVADNIQWNGKGVTGGKSFVTPSDAEQMLIGKSDGLRVGGTSDGSSAFSFTNNFLSTQMDSKTYYAGVKADFMSNTWELLEEGEGGAISNDIKDTKIAFFKKVVSPQKVTTLKFASDNYAVNLSAGTVTLSITCTGVPASDVQWSSSNTDVATVNSSGVVTLKKRGTVVITASVAENEYHDKASATCTVRIDDSSSSEPGSINRPLSVAEAKELAEKGKVTIGSNTYTLQKGVNYYIIGKVSKVNSGMMALFGDMDFSSMGGGESGMNFDETMDDMDFDMDSMEEMGFDMSSMGIDMSSLFSSDKVTYYISDDGTKDNQLKVLNGLGTVKSNSGGAVEYNNIPNLSPGDCVIVCGPLVYSEDTNMLSGLMGGGDDEPKMSGKVDELNYLYSYDPTLLVENHEIYVNKTLDGSVSVPLEGNLLYSIDNDFNGEVKITVNEGEGKLVQAPTYKTSDEEIAKWDEDTKKIVGVNVGTAKITVKVKVILQPDDDATTDVNEEKSYTMKRKFKLTVLTRDLDPAGYYDGNYKVTADAANLEEGSRLILVGTRVKDGNTTDYIMGQNNSTMGGGKSGSKATIDYYKIPCKDVPKGTLEIVLEKDGDFWNLNVGQDEKGTPLYLYATAKNADDDDMMEMFSPSSGMKVGTKDDVAKDATEEGVTVSMKASIAITVADLISYATIKFDGISDEKNNTIMLSSGFDMESMMNMFNGDEQGGGEQGGGEQGGGTPSFDMGSFDMFMASFNTKKPADATAEAGKDPKSFLPRIYRFVPDESFDITIGETGWRTIVTCKDVDVPENVVAYTATKVQSEESQNQVTLLSVDKLKGGEPYLLYTEPGSVKNFTMTLTTDEVPVPTNNILKKSDRTTTGSKASSSIYVLAKKTQGAGFYKWVGDELGAGRVYLPIDAGIAGAREFYGFFIDESTSIQSIENAKLSEGIYYDLQGRRVRKPGKGLYLLDGKKVVIK